MKAFDINITAENTERTQWLISTLMEGYDSNSLKEIANSLPGMVGAGSLRITINGFGFNTGQDLLDWVQDSDESLNLSDVKQ